MAPIAKRRRLSPPDTSASKPAKPAPSSEEKVQDFYRNAAGWNLEQDYETRPRKVKKKKEETRLPIKTSEGWVEHAPVVEEQQQEGDADSFLGSGDEDEQADGQQEEDAVEEPPQPQISPKEQIIQAKEELARVASLISEDPEEHIGQLKKLQAFAHSPNKTVVKLTLATQLAIYRDIIPGYRIRSVSSEDMRAKMSKDVRKLRGFEQSLLSGYHDYVRSLAKAAKNSGDRNKDKASVASVAISCVCTLLNAVPHFNFRGDIINTIVGRLSTRNIDQDFHKCREALEILFRDDEDGNASREAVDLLCKMMKSRSYNIHESVLNTFLHLRLLSEFIHKGSNSRIDKESDDQPKQKQKREFRTKKERKRMREVKEVEKEMQEADAVVSHEQRDKNQSEMLKLVFVAYFRILKQRVPQLMGAVLEGLARYAHLINQDFFGDILEALRELVASTESAYEEEDEEEDEDAATAPRNINRESLLCIITAFALLEGQDAHKSANSLHIDLDFFIAYLYKTLMPTSLNPDLELSAKSLRLRDPHNTEDTLPQNHKINVQTTTVLLLRSLSSVLLPPQNLRGVPPLRIAAFAKQLLTASLQLPEKSCLAMLGLLQQVAKVQGKKISALWFTEERKGDGVFNPLKEEVEGSNPFATTIWEGELLKHHYCPQVRDAISTLEKGMLAARS